MTQPNTNHYTHMKEEKFTISIKVYFPDGKYKQYTCPQGVKSAYAVLDAYKQLEGVTSAVLCFEKVDSPSELQPLEVIDRDSVRSKKLDFDPVVEYARLKVENSTMRDHLEGIGELDGLIESGSISQYVSSPENGIVSI